MTLSTAEHVLLVGGGAIAAAVAAPIVIPAALGAGAGLLAAGGLGAVATGVGALGTGLMTSLGITATAGTAALAGGYATHKALVKAGAVTPQDVQNMINQTLAAQQAATPPATPSK